MPDTRAGALEAAGDGGPLGATLAMHQDFPPVAGPGALARRRATYT